MCWDKGHCLLVRYSRDCRLLSHVLGIEQCLDRGLNGTGIKRVAHDRLHDGAIEEGDELIGQPFGILRQAACGLALEEAADPQLVIAGHEPSRVARVG